MNKTIINVPDGVRFLSEWKGFDLANFPSKCILNKQIPGCGFTEWCIRSSCNLVLASPRKTLLYNKWEQHEKEVFLVVNEMDSDPNVDRDISKDQNLTPDPTKEELDEVKKKNSDSFYKIRKELIEYYNEISKSGKPFKILVTYDSYRIVREVLVEIGIFRDFIVVVDEFQSILHDSRFKSDTELQFMTNLMMSHSVIFASATPMMEEYLDMLNEFKDLPYYELDWKALEPGRVTIPKLDVKVMRTVTEEATKVIKEFLDGKFEEKVVVRENNTPVKVVSNKIVLYMNAVNSIISIIKRLNLDPGRINILCSDTEENKKKIRKKLGKRYTIGKVPLENEPEPDITFCTRTVYLGADFYSKCARSYIFSDANIESLAVDISEDLPQILGRQRLEENPWKNHAYFFYRATANYRNFKKEDFDKVIERKKKVTESLLRSYGTIDSSSKEDSFNLAHKYEEAVKIKCYLNDYVAVNRIYSSNGDLTFHPLRNELVLVNEIRAFRIQQIDYRDRFTVFSTIHNKITKGSVVDSNVSKVLEVYQSLTTITDKLRLLCECPLEKEELNIVLNQISDADDVKSFFTIIGKDRIKELGYNTHRLRKELSIISFSPLVLEEYIYQSFKVGDKIPLSEIKERLGNIYSSVSYKATPKAKDIENYFEVREYMFSVTGSDGSRKRGRGYELLKKKR